MRPCGCNTAIWRVPAVTLGPLATVPGKAKAVATPMAPVAACEAWQRRGVKYREVRLFGLSPSLTSTGFGITLSDTSPRPINVPA